MGVTPVLLLCVLAFTNTSSIGAFPVLLPDLGAAAGLSDARLGALAAAFGLARMVMNIPAGLLATRRLGRAVLLAPFVLVAGVACIGSGGPFGVLLLGRALVGVAHTFGMVGALTAILRYSGAGAVSSALNALEMAGMLGVLAGMALAGALPSGLPWNVAFLVACAPQVAGLAVLPRAVASLPASSRTREAPLAARAAAAGEAPRAGARSPLVPLAFAAGAVIAVAWSAVSQFIIPIRGSREFGLGRSGVAQLLVGLQLVDAVALMPVGALADRRRTTAVLGATLLALAAGMALVAFGGVRLAAVGCVLFGAGLAGWMLPLGVLRRATAPGGVAWRTAIYRIGVDAGIFLGPLVAGLLGHGAVGLLAWACVGLLAVGGLVLAGSRS